MVHSDSSKSFFSSLKATIAAFAFSIGGLLAGFVFASQLGVFELAPWAIALYPAIVSAKGVTGGLLSGRLGTALHLGTIYPRFLGNTKSFYKLIEALVVITLATSVAMTSISLLFGYLFGGVTFADFPDILSVVMSTMAIGLSISFVTIKVAFASFKKGLDPDIVVYPVMSTVADIFITICYFAMLNLFFFSQAGILITASIAVAHLLLVFYIIPKNRHQTEFTKTIKESLVTMMFVAVIANITGTVLKRINILIENRKEIYTVYPALMALIGDVGSVVGSTATTKLALGLLSPTFSSIRHHTRTILSAWTASLIMFVILAISALSIHGIFSLPAFFSLILTLIMANVIAITAIVILSYGVSILTFKKGLDPDNFVIPIESSFADSAMTVALLTALILVG